MDRVKPYLLNYMDELIFSELSETYLAEASLDDFLTGVPVPLRAEDVAKAATEGLPISAIGSAIARVIGIDPEFRYAPEYRTFLHRFLGKRASGMLLTEAKSAADAGDFENACIWQRAALAIAPDDPVARYGYATVLGALYSESMDREKIGNLKAESLENFETLTIEHPDFAPGWYYLGYLYLNLGLYTKASVSWKRYLELNPDGEEAAETRREIVDRLAQLDTPLAIENACNLVLSGNYRDGLMALAHFALGQYADWWPLWYHMGLAHKGLGEITQAEKAFKKVLGIDGTQLDTMRELIAIYEEAGNGELVKKYTNKIILLEKRTVQETEAENNND